MSCIEGSEVKMEADEKKVRQKEVQNEKETMGNKEY